MKPCGVNADGGLVWVASYSADELVAIDPASNERRGPAVAVGDQPCGIVSGAGSLWVEIFGESRVDRVDPASREVVASIPVGLQAWDIAFGAGSVWCSNAGEGIVSRIDPATDEVVAIVAVAVRTQKRGRSLSERSTGRANLLRTSAGQHSSARGSLFSVGSFRFAALSRPP